ncbi:hypothetical protein AB0G97_08880 [Streptomyces sp. NPDC020755]|uniref:hypothetical protein n=1 Tax=Streptomyces sp. NPDC020755 TaxID=3154790 RepID=UPI0033CA8316
MIIVYTPAGEQPTSYDARTLLVSEASAAARTIDQTWPEVKANLVDEDLDAMRAVVWILRKRAEPTLTFDGFDPVVDEMVTRYDKREIENWVTRAFGMMVPGSDVTAEQVAVGLREVPAAAADPEHARAFIEQCRAEAAGGKDGTPATPPAPARTTSRSRTSSSSEPSTSDSSPTS